MRKTWRMMIEALATLGRWRIDGCEEHIVVTVPIRGDKQMLLPGIADIRPWDGREPVRRRMGYRQ